MSNADVESTGTVPVTVELVIVLESIVVEQGKALGFVPEERPGAVQRAAVRQPRGRGQGAGAIRTHCRTVLSAAGGRAGRAPRVDAASPFPG